jgi:ABC-2 type transport system ATP-binding protein
VVGGHVRAICAKVSAVADNAIETSGLCKAFGATRALDGLDLAIQAGSVFGLLGPNGAGKTTTIRVLATLLAPTAGRAVVLGHDVVAEPAKVRAKVSLTGQYASVDEDLTGHENLVLIGRLLGLSWREARGRATELLAAFDLADAAGRQVRTYSGGMRRRIDIAASLVTRAELLFLDEPTTGLDPRSRNQVWDLVRAIAADGTTVLLTTQHLEEADRLAERLAVVDHGKVIAEGTSRELKASIGGGALRFHLADPGQGDAARALCAARAGDAAIAPSEPGSVAVKVPDAAVAAELIGALTTARIAISDFALEAPSLDDVFFALTGRPAGPHLDGVPRGVRGAATAPTGATS